MKQVSASGATWPSSSESDSGSSPLSTLLADLTTRFCSGNRWMLRQSYVNICNQLVTDRALPLEDFGRLLLSPLLALKQDRVPNVRLVLARVINFQLRYHGKRAPVTCPSHDGLVVVAGFFFLSSFHVLSTFSTTGLHDVKLLFFTHVNRILCGIGQSLSGVASGDVEPVIGRPRPRRFLLRLGQARRGPFIGRCLV